MPRPGDPLSNYRARAKATLRKIMTTYRVWTPLVEVREYKEYIDNLENQLKQMIDEIRSPEDISKLEERLKQTWLTEAEVKMLLPTRNEWRRINKCFKR